MEFCHEFVHARHIVLLQQEEPNFPKAYNSKACERFRVFGRRLDPSEVHDLRSPNQALR